MKTPTTRVQAYVGLASAITTMGVLIKDMPSEMGVIAATLDELNDHVANCLDLLVETEP